MQTVEMTINHLTGKGWKDTNLTFSVDETIGTQAGRDVYATARGTAIKFMRKFFLANGTYARLAVNGQTHITIRLENGKFIKEMTK